MLTTLLLQLKLVNTVSWILWKRPGNALLPSVARVDCSWITVIASGVIKYTYEDRIIRGINERIVKYKALKIFLLINSFIVKVNIDRAKTTANSGWSVGDIPINKLPGIDFLIILSSINPASKSQNPDIKTTKPRGSGLKTGHTCTKGSNPSKPKKSIGRKYL